MIVSHFELIYKPQSPNAPTGSAAVDNLIQGYFLELTNLSEQSIKYKLALKTVSVSDPNRSVGGNALFILDRPDSDNEFSRFSGAVAGQTFSPTSGLIELEPNETALLAVLPSAFGPIPGVDTTPLTAPTFEVRGIVEITIPSLFTSSSFFDPSVPQAAVDIATLITPQNRTTYFKADGTISDQTQASLPISNGQALTEITPEPSKPRFFQLDPVFVGELIGTSGFDATDLIAGALASSDLTAKDLTAFNKAMADSGIGFAIERRKVQALEPAE
jgi:hypothetical protein